MDAAPIPVETLLAHREWVRSVARAVVRDPNAAADVEQETWVAAIETPPRDASSPRGWLGAVVRSRARRMGRSAARRGVRESAAARDEATQSAAELAEIADTHRRVVQAVVELPEPYRQTILLRYFEGLSVEDVAARMAVPIDTTRSRISRGLARLRERLSRELGNDERPWHLALAPLIGARETAAPAGAAAGGTAMATKTAWILGSVLAAGGLAALVVTRLPASAQDVGVVAAAPAPVPAPPPPPTRGDEPKAKAPVPAAPAAAPDEPKPAPVPATAAEKLAATNVTAAWSDTPLLEILGEISAKVDVDFFIAAESEPGVRDARLTLEMGNAASSVVIELIAGTAGLSTRVEGTRVVVLPGDGKRDEAKALVPIERLVVDAKRTITVKGVVVDEQGAPVEGATVESERETPVVTRSGADGSFAFEFGRPFGSVHASLPGHVPSWEFEVDGKYGDTVEMRLALRGPASRVDGVVTDAEGRQVRDALVEIISSNPLNGGRPPANAGPVVRLRLTSDANGRFTADTLIPGDFQVFVYPPRGPVERMKATAKPDETVHLDVRLPATVLWRGTLRDADGKPVAGAMISAGPGAGARTGRDGSFQLTGVLPGRTRLQIQAPGGRGETKWVVVESGGEFTSDLVIGGGARIAGRLVDEVGASVPGLWVALLPMPPGTGGAQEGQRAVDGSFDLTGVESGSYRVIVSRDSALPLAVSDEVAGGAASVEVRVPKDALVAGKVHARVVHESGAPAVNATLVLRNAATGSEASARNDAVGSVGIPDVPRGRYLVWLTKGQGAIELPVRDVAAGGDVDLGTVPFPAPVTVSVRWEVTGDVASSYTFVRWGRVLSDGSLAACREPSWFKGAPNLAELRLPPGRYVVHVEGGSIQSAERTLDVSATGEASLTVPVRVAPPRRIAFRFPGDVPGRTRLRVSDADGQVSSSVLRGGETSLRLVAGSYKFEVDVAVGRTLAGTLDVPAENAPESFIVELR